MSTFQRGSTVALPPSIPLTQNTAPVREFKCLYTHDKRQKKKRWHDGWLRYHTFNKRVMVYDDTRNFVGDMHYTDSGEVGEGDDLTFEAFLVQVSECTNTIQQDLTLLFTPKLRRREAIQQEASAGTGGTPTARPSSQSPLPQSRIQGGPFRTTAPQTPLSQLRPKSLNALLGTAKGPYGRALLPTHSPFEEREKGLNGTRIGEPPSKRRRRSAATTDTDGIDDMDSHIIPTALEQADPVYNKEPPRHRVARRSRQQDMGKGVPCEIPPHASHRSKEVQPRGPRPPNAPNPVPQEARRRARSPAISIDSDSESVEASIRTVPSHSRENLAIPPPALKEKVPPLAEKYPPQPLRILATSSRKKKLLYQDAPRKPSGGERDSHIHLHSQQQEGQQERRQGQNFTWTSVRRNRVSGLRDGSYVSHGTRDTPQRERQGDPAPLCSPQQRRQEKYSRVERVNSPSEQGRGDQLLPAAGKITSARITAGHAPTTPDGRSTSMEKDLDGPWSEESNDLFDWQPAPKGRKGASTGAH